MRGSVTQVAWETRGGSGPYYTRSVRDGDRVRRQYLGSGPRAEAAARADRLLRDAREANRVALQSAFSQIAKADAQVKALCDAAEATTRAALLVAGYHRHDRGAWRRRRA